MEKLLTRGGVELIAVVLGITLSLWVDDKKDLSVVKKNNVKTLKSIKAEVALRIKYIDRKMNQYKRDIEVGDYIIKNWNKIDYDSIASITKNDRDIILTLKAYRAINLPTSIYNSLNSDGSIGKLEQDSIKIILNDLYEVIPAHIVDGVENERVLYHSFNEYIIKNYPIIVNDAVGKKEYDDYGRFFDDDVVLGYVLEKTHLRKFILKLITNYYNRLIELEKMI
jgi:hypothetical protein|tara:strand:- start:166 stop:837 length:672 start_codon:yes stop_codon:yes gene_type:complete